MFATAEALAAAGAVSWEIPTLPYLEKLRRSAATPDDLSPVAREESPSSDDNNNKSNNSEEDEEVSFAGRTRQKLLDVTPTTPAVFVSQSTPAPLSDVLPKPTPVSCNRSFSTVSRAPPSPLQVVNGNSDDDNDDGADVWALQKTVALDPDSMTGTLLLPVSASASREVLVERVSHLRTALQQSVFEVQQLHKLVAELGQKQGHMATVNNDLYLHIRELREQVASLLAAQSSGSLPRTEDGFVSVQQQEALGMSLRQLRGEALDTANRELYKLKTALVDKDARIGALRLQVRLRDIDTNAQHTSLEAECERLRGEVARLSILRAGKAQDQEIAARAIERDERLHKAETQLTEANAYIETLKTTLREVRDKTMGRCAQLADELQAEKRRTAELEERNVAMQLLTKQPATEPERLPRPACDDDDEVQALRSDNDRLRERLRALENEVDATHQINDELRTLLDQSPPASPRSTRTQHREQEQQQTSVGGVARVLWEEAIRECESLRIVNERLVARNKQLHGMAHHQEEQPHSRPVPAEARRTRGVQTASVRTTPKTTLCVQPTAHVTVAPSSTDDEEEKASALQAQLRLLHQHIDQLEAERVTARSAASHQRGKDENENEEDDEDDADVKKALDSSLHAVVESQRETIARLKAQVKTLSTGDLQLNEAFLVQKRILRSTLQQLDAERKNVEALRRSGSMPPIEALSPEQTRFLVEQHVRLSMQRHRSDELEDEDHVTFQADESDDDFVDSAAAAAAGDDDDEEEEEEEGDDDDVVLQLFHGSHKHRSSGSAVVQHKRYN